MSPTAATTQSTFQIYCAGLAKITSGLALIMTYIWANTENVEKKYLGGLNWNEKVFNWHPVLMVAGFGFAFTCGLTSFRHTFLSKPINKGLHTISYILTIICFSLGLKAVWKSHDQNSKDYRANLYSLHAWIGLAAVVIFAQNFILGIYHFLNRFTSIPQRQTYMPLHVVLGTVAFITSLIAIQTGIVESTAFDGGCGYHVNEKDTNPAEHYHEIPEGCKLSQGIGIMMYVAGILALLSIWEFRSIPQSESAASSVQQLLNP